MITKKRFIIVVGLGLGLVGLRLFLELQHNLFNEEVSPMPVPHPKGGLMHPSWPRGI